MVRLSAFLSYTMPIPDPDSLPWKNSTGPGAVTTPVLLSNDACSVCAVKPFDSTSFTSPFNVTTDSSLPTSPSLPVTVNERPSPRSSADTLTPTSFVEPS
jgi:hypothetical protein